MSGECEKCGEHCEDCSWDNICSGCHRIFIDCICSCKCGVCEETKQIIEKNDFIIVNGKKIPIKEGKFVLDNDIYEIKEVNYSPLK